MFGTLKDLVLAMLNATLILLALTLFLGWKFLAAVDTARTGLTETLAEAAPLRSEVAAMRSDIRGLREEISLLANRASPDPSALREIGQGMDRLEGRLDAAQGALNTLARQPEDLLFGAAQSAAGAFVDRLGALRGCKPAI